MTAQRRIRGSLLAAEELDLPNADAFPVFRHVQEGAAAWPVRG
jgi:hypothetical protein